MEDPQAFGLTKEDLGSRIRVLSLSGELDLAGSPTLRAEFSQSMQEGHDLILADLTEATMVDSTTLSVLLNAHRRLTRRNGALAIVTDNSSILRVLEVTLLDRTFELHPTREAALERLRQAEAGS